MLTGIDTEPLGIREYRFKVLKNVVIKTVLDLPVSSSYYRHKKETRA